MADVLPDDPASGVQSSSEDQRAEMAVESLVQGRAKRSTAGRHMAALIDAAADDDLTLLFEEVEDDQEFAMDVEAAEDEDAGLDSSSDDDDDQGPAAPEDYEGEKELQKQERRKRRAQNDLRFQTLRKRVKIDPTAVSSVPAPAPRPKKKSERISWLPTTEDGPTRSSSRRQTMVNKELTHARLKDSQEKRIRIIATMKEAEKRKAHLKPKEMTQEDHLAEAARVERTNSKSLNRWELSEKKKAEERKAKIEALQNRRLEGPVISYWSGVATWVDGKLTKVGKVEIKAKPEKEEPRKKKKEKDEKSASVSQSGLPAMSGAAAEATVPVTDGHAPDAAVAPVETGATGPSVGVAPTDTMPSSHVQVVVSIQKAANGQAPVDRAADAETTERRPSDEQAAEGQQHLPAPAGPEHSATTENQPGVNAGDKRAATPVAITVPDGSSDTKQQAQENQAGADNLLGSETQDSGINTTNAPPLPQDQVMSSTNPHNPTPEEQVEKAIDRPGDEPDAMEIDPKPETKPVHENDSQQQEQKSSPPAPAATAASAPRDPHTLDNMEKSIEAPSLSDAATGPSGQEEGQRLTTGGVAAPAPVPASALAPEHAGSRASGVSDSDAPEPSQTPYNQVSPSSAAPPPVTSADIVEPPMQDSAPNQQEPQGERINVNNLQESTQSHEATPTAGQPEVPAAPTAPPVIEHTGRILTILENFDDRTAQSKKFSMYFNAKKPPRLTKISSSLCVITSLPSRYRDPETSLPYANSFAYKQIRRMLSQGYIWSSMLGCFVGPGGIAARGVPGRFLGKETDGDDEKEKDKGKDAEKSKAEGEKGKADKPALGSEGDSKSNPMDVDA
ncbi:YL1 nuclear protein [Penicillium ucsense]|uniref:YL1 nuclear protein n=1 Tax=Penicillium ucsense TaxID=2839758 RepID=A0A8J8W273_9EURO|nr:YL1 nuclear protein [Penicillium ucsense]KAF7734166.1 YL1 nuclear protein [Penicillium ucsense]